MILVDKILFLKKNMGLSDHEFLSRFDIKKGTFKKWLSKELFPTKNDVLLICKEFDLDIDDFMDNTSTLDKENIKQNEHMCILNPNKGLSRTDIILEDFAREDNSRYEEKD